MYRMVAIDLDGTLLGPDSKISDENLKAVAGAIKKGVRVVICSGRIFNGARLFARQLASNEPVITCNGALIRDLITGEVLYDRPLSREDCYGIIDICHSEGIYFHAYVDNTMYAEILEHDASYYFKMNEALPQGDKVEIRIVESFADELAKGIKAASKFVVVSHDPEKLSHVRSRVLSIPGVDVMSSGRNNFEIVAAGVNKGAALKFLSERYGIPSENIIAIGDNENDYSMIKFAGLGVAMGNAEEFIKEAADYTTSANDRDGVAKVLKEFVI